MNYLTFRIGTSYAALNNSLLFASDIKSIINGKPSLCIGCEYLIGRLIRIRTGFEACSEKEKSLMWTAGMGFAITKYSIDYAYEMFGELDTTHRFTISAKF